MYRPLAEHFGHPEIMEICRVLVFAAYRVLSVFLIQTFYVPDEFWQSLEVAHNMVYGYGYQTWEWKHGIRGSFHPFIVACIYKLLNLLYLDYPAAITLMPRIAQALLTAESDQYFFLLCQRFNLDVYWARMLIFTNWFWFYCGSRTLINTFETCLTTIALYHYPWNFLTEVMKKYQKVNRSLSAHLKQKSINYLIPAAIVCIVRPTALTIWGPLVLFQLKFTSPVFLKDFILHCIVPVVLVILPISIALDYMWYGKFVIPALNFFLLNISEGVASFYGTHPFYWYITQGLPVVLGLHYIPFIVGLFSISMNWFQKLEYKFKIIYITIMFNLVLLSFIPHKEFRFLLPLTPMMMLVVGKVLSEFFTRRMKMYKLIWSISLILGFIIPTLLFGGGHQLGAMSVTNYLRDSTLKCNTNCYFLYLMPCHSTPLYSHLHVNVTTRFITCEPPIMGNNYDESEDFFANPMSWLQKNWDDEKPPTHVAFFDSIEESIAPFLAEKGFIKIRTFLQTFFAKRNSGRNIFVYEPAYKIANVPL